MSAAPRGIWLPFPGFCARRGWTFYSTGGEGLFAEVLRRDGINVIIPPRPAQRWLGTLLSGRAFRLPLAVFHLLRVLAKGQFAIVHFFLPEAYILGAPLAYLLRTRLLVMSRRSLNNYQQNVPFGALIERRLHSLMAAVPRQFAQRGETARG
jgi:hypothetical protein